MVLTRTYQEHIIYDSLQSHIGGTRRICRTFLPIRLMPPAPSCIHKAECRNLNRLVLIAQGLARSRARGDHCRHSLLGGVPQGSSRARVISAMLISPAYRPWRRAIAGDRRGAVLRLRRPGQHSNTAKRMESYGLPGRVHISATIRQALGEAFYFEPRVRSRSKAKGRWRPISSIAEKKRPAPREGCRPRL